MSDFVEGRLPAEHPDGVRATTADRQGSRFARVVPSAPPAARTAHLDRSGQPSGRLAAMEASLAEQIIQLEDQVLRLRSQLREFR